MPLKTLRTVWLAIALICVIVCVDFVAIVQGWPISIGTKLVLEVSVADFKVEHRPQAALHGLLAALPFLVLSMWLASLHARRADGGFAKRIPFRLLDIDPETHDGKIVQAIAFVVTFLLPLYAVGHFWKTIYNQKLCFEHIPAPGQMPIIHRDLSIFTLDWAQQTTRSIWSILDNEFRFASTDLKGCDGPTFQPFLEPMVLAVITLLALWFFGRFLWFATMNRRQARVRSSRRP